MSSHAIKYNEFMKKNKAKIEAAFKVATDRAMCHELYHTRCEDNEDEGYPLTDMLTQDGKPITEGKHEIELLLDFVLTDALMAYEGLIDS